MEKTSWTTLVDWKHLNSSNLLEEQTIMTISKIAKEEIVSDNGRKETCIVARFSDYKLPMCLNKTNCKAITKMYGTDKIEDWIGKKIEVFVSTTKVKGEVVNCLRIKPRIPKEKNIIICEKCGNEITDAEGFTVKQIIEGSQKSFGQNLCFTCAKKISDKKKEIEKAKKLEEEKASNKPQIVDEQGDEVDE